MPARDPSAFLSFILHLEEIYELALVTDRADDFNKRSMPNQIVHRKLPHLADKWGERCARNEAAEGKDLTFKDFLEFLTFKQSTLDFVARGKVAENAQGAKVSAKVAAATSDEEEMPRRFNGGGRVPRGATPTLGGHQCLPGFWLHLKQSSHR